MLSTAQAQDPTFSQFMFNPLYYNPAYAGSDSTMVRSTVVYRNQWTNFAFNPVNGVFAIDGRFEGIGGLGLTAAAGREGSLNTLQVKVAYANHLELGNGELRAGVDLGLHNKNLPNATPAAAPNDNSSTTVSNFDMSAGVYYHTSTVQLGASSTHVVEPAFDFGNNGSINTERQYFFTLGFNIEANDQTTVAPIIFTKTSASNTEIQAGSNFILNQKLILGGFYRMGNSSDFDESANDGSEDELVGKSINIIAGFIASNFQITYSFDRSIVDVNGVALGPSHELRLTYHFIKG